MILDRFQLQGRVAIVTGCDTGLGQGMACALAQAGADVVGINVTAPDRHPGPGRGAGPPLPGPARQPVGHRLHRGPGGQAKAFGGRVDILVNNAGIIRREDAIKFSEKDWDDVIDLNLKSVFFLAQAVARQFMAQGSGGKIINVASMLSFQGGMRVPSYTASKSGVVGITRLLANEWAQHGINVNAIAPGYMATNNTAALRADDGRSAAILERIPAGRWGVPEDLAGPVVFLASDASNYVNGYTVAVDGGWLTPPRSAFGASPPGGARQRPGRPVRGAWAIVREQAARLPLRAALRAGRAAVQAVPVRDELCAQLHAVRPDGPAGVHQGCRTTASWLRRRPAVPSRAWA
jgi:2-deoxy-D-gluconate 3-dehydrogenase